MPKTETHYPIFTMYSLEHLANELGYEVSTLLLWKDGYSKFSKRFRFTAAKILGKNEESLFGPQEPAP